MSEKNFEPIRRATSEEMDLLIGKVFPVLDDGFIRVIDYMGNDQSIVQAARTSYGSGTKKISEDRGLIRYLMRHRHTTPLEMCELKLHIRIPMDAWRQFIRHRTASVNEYSTRYSLAIDERQTTKADEWRLQSTDNKQGSDGFLPETAGVDGYLNSGENLSRLENKLHVISKEVYEHRIDAGVAREQARKDLPLSTYTEAYWKCDLHNLLHFLSLRMDGHAQKEIRDYANVIGKEIVAKWVPLAWEAFEDYRLGGSTLSAMEMKMLGFLNNYFARGDEDWLEYGKLIGWLLEDQTANPKNREMAEFTIKLENMGFSEIPWQF